MPEAVLRTALEEAGTRVVLDFLRLEGHSSNSRYMGTLLEGVDDRGLRQITQLLRGDSNFSFIFNKWLLRGTVRRPVRGTLPRS